MNESANEGPVNNERTDQRGIEQLQQDLFLAKCEIKTAIRDVALNLNYISDLFLKLRGDFSEINERLHGIELRQKIQNSST